MELQQENTYPRLPVKPEFDGGPIPLRSNVSIFDLINAVNAVMKRLGTREETREIFEDPWTVSQKIEELLQLIHDRHEVKFSELFANASSRSEVVVTFLAILELIRLRQLVAMQEESFGEITITRAAQVMPAETGVAEPAPVATEAEPDAAHPVPQT
jgi:segregation and condensation protein A